MNIFDRVNRLDFFEKNLKVAPNSWLSSKILDYGGNRGNVLEDLKERQPGVLFDYTCVDVDQDALDFGKAHSPECSWIKSNCYNQAYNSTGNHEYTLPFEDNTFDYILAYSVHSHTTLEQMVYDIKELLRILKPGGKIGTTVPDHQSVKFFLNKRRREFGHTVNEGKFFDIKDYLYFINHDTVTKEFDMKPVQYFVSFYNITWLTDYLKKLNFKAYSPASAPVNGYSQKLIVIEK